MAPPAMTFNRDGKRYICYEDGSESDTSFQAAPPSARASPMRVTNSEKAGVTFPVGRIHRYMREEYAGRVSKKAAVFMAGVLDYMVTEVLENAAKVTSDAGRQRILPRHLMKSIRTDSDLDSFSRKSVIPGAGVLPKQWALIDR